MTRTDRRTANLARTLLERRRELREHVRDRVRDGRAVRALEGADDLEHSEADMQGDLEFALLQMRAETLVRVDAALARLDAGTYGFCVECEAEISEPRLRALPFAVRCQSCEALREQHARSRQSGQSRAGLIPLFAARLDP